MIIQVPDGVPYQGYWKIAMLVILCVVTIVIVGLRLYSRSKVLKQSKLGWTDFCIVLSTVPMLVFAALQIVNMLYGLRVHKKDFGKIFDNHHDYLDVYIATWRIAFFQRLLHESSACLIKFSILLFLYSLSPYRTFHIFIYILMFFNVILALISSFMIIFQCRPIRAAFFPPTHRPPGSHCFYGWSILCQVLPVCTTVLDALCWLIPMYLARRVKGRWKARVRVAMVLCIGLIAVIASIVKIVLLKWAIDYDDESWYLFDVGCWATIELSMAIICACSPALMPIFRLISRRIRYRIRYPDRTQRSGQRSTTVHQDQENIEVEVHFGPSISLRRIGQSSPDVSSNHENIPDLGTVQHQGCSSPHTVHISGRTYYTSTEAFANANSSGGLGREASVASSLGTVDGTLNHECSTANVELENGGGNGRRGDPELDLGDNIA